MRFGIDQKALAVKGDIAEPSSISHLFDAAEQAFGSIGILVSNAGIMHTGPIGAATNAEFEAQCAVNIGGVFRGMREAANRLQEGGAILSLSSSVVGSISPPTASTLRPRPRLKA